MKLTKAMKEQIVSGLVDEKLSSLEAALKQEEHVLAERAYKHLLGTHLSVVKTLPENYFEQKSSLNLYFSTTDSNGKPTTTNTTLNFPFTVRVPAFLRWHYALGLPIDHPLTAELQAFRDKKVVISAKRDKLKNSLDDALAQINTDKLLLELLPESEPHVRALTVEDNTKALAVSFAQARQLLAEA